MLSLLLCPTKRLITEWRADRWRDRERGREKERLEEEISSMSIKANFCLSKTLGLFHGMLKTSRPFSERVTSHKEMNEKQKKNEEDRKSSAEKQTEKKKNQKGRDRWEIKG